MAGPITWRTIQGSSPYEGAGRLMQSAQSSLNSGFNALQGVLDNRLALEEENRGIVSDNNTNDARDFLSQFETVEEFEAAKQSGAIDQQLQQYGNQYDRSAIRNALTQMPEQLRTREMQANEFSDQRLEREQRALVDEALSAAARGDDATFNRLMDENEFLNEGQLAARGAETLRGYQQGIYAGNQDRRSAAQDARQAEFHRMQVEDANQLRLEREQAKALDTTVGNLVTQYGSEIEARQALIAQLDEQGIRGKARIEAIQDLAKTYQTHTGLTAEQTEVHNLVSERLQSQADMLVADEQLQLDRVKQDHPLEPVYTFDEPEKVTEAEARKQAYEIAPKTHWGQSTSDTIDDALDKLRKERGVPEGFNLGPVLKQALMSTQTVGEDNNLWVLDKRYTPEDLQKNLLEIYDRAVLHEANKSRVRAAEDAFENTRRRIMGEASNGILEFRNALQSGNKFPTPTPR